MNTVIVVASGTGTRMKSAIPKQFLMLKGQPILLRTLRKFTNHRDVDKIVLVISKGMESYYNKYIKPELSDDEEISIVYGGEERYESVYNGLRYLTEETDIVMIHDGVRPFITEEEIGQVVDAAKKHGAAILGKPVTNTIKLVENQRVIKTLDRKLLYEAMTPQAFKFNVILTAYQKFNGSKTEHLATDDAMIVETFIQEVHIVEGSSENIKVTNPVDIIIGEAILDSRGET